MIVERTQNEILVRLPLETKLMEFQELYNFLKYKEIVSYSAASDDDIEEISNLVKKEIQKKFKAQRKMN